MSTAVMIMPGVQKPHCKPWFSRNASCMGCSLSAVARPSIVSTSAPSACSASMVHDLTALPDRDAAAALGGVAAHVRPGQAQLLTQELHQQGAGLDGGLDGFAVHRQRNGRHCDLLICGARKNL